jgi:hypothetical protein
VTKVGGKVEDHSLGVENNDLLVEDKIKRMKDKNVYERRRRKESLG